MYDIRIAGESMPQASDASMTITAINPALDRESIDRVFTYTISIPVTPPVRKALGHPDRIDVSLTGQKYDAELYIAGMPFSTGDFKITNANRHQIKGVFRADTLGIMEELEDIDLRGIFDIISIPQVNEPEIIIGFDYPSFKYYIIVDGVKFQYTAQTPDIPLDDIIDYFYTQINNVYTGLATNVGDTLKLSYSVLPDMEVVVGHGCYIIDASPSPEAQQDNFLDYIEDWITNGSAKFCFPVVHNFNLYDDKNFPGWSGFINYIRDGVAKANEQVPKFKNPGADPIEQKPSWEVSWIPFLRVSHILKQIAEEIDIVWDENAPAWTDIDVYNLLQYNNATLDQSSEYFDAGEGAYFHINHLMQSIDLNRHVPDMDAREYINALLEYLCLWVKREGTSLTLKKVQDQFEQDPIDWTEKADDGYEIEHPEEFGYEIGSREDETDAKDIAGQLNPFFFGDGKLKIETEFGAPHWEDRPIPSTEQDWLVPVLLQPGTTEEFGLGENDTGLKLMYYRGFQEDSEGLDYPLASVDIYNYNGDPVGSISLDWTGDNGIHEQLWKGLAQLKVGRTIRKTVRLGIHDLIKLLEWDNPLRYIKHEMGTARGVVKQVKFTVTRKHLLPAEVEIVIPAS